MKRLIVKLVLSVLLQCVAVYGYIFLIVEFQDYYLLAKIVSLFLIFFVQGLVYKIYKTKPIEREIYKDIYMVINGLFIVFEAFLFSVAL